MTSFSSQYPPPLSLIYAAASEATREAFTLQPNSSFLGLGGGSSDCQKIHKKLKNTVDATKDCLDLAFGVAYRVLYPLSCFALNNIVRSNDSWHRYSKEMSEALRSRGETKRKNSLLKEMSRGKSDKHKRDNYLISKEGENSTLMIHLVGRPKYFGTHNWHRLWAYTIAEQIGRSITKVTEVDRDIIFALTMEK
ncbi:hypothetical protein LguiB_005977 [Lonicera macranthoides]